MRRLARTKPEPPLTAPRPAQDTIYVKNLLVHERGVISLPKPFTKIE
jgi:hypothetical protein